ncbi:MAG: hypothetical protein CMN77_08560 [Spirochaetaceae bacterium]|nr:hypothetical protein [Spirochaetaceae bacterium]|tara:strand:+ start:64391 stop:64993 length:603 start_codon:yes stop_codon:yes gene_type:complete
MARKPSGKNHSGGPAEKPEIRIRKAADRLFYEQGFEATGINRVLDEAGAHKQSLYLHFESKEDLGRAYVQTRGAQVMDLLRTLTRKKDPVAMVESWVQILKRQARNQSFYGCPLANFSAQTLSHGNSFQPVLKSMLEEWLNLLGEYFREVSKTGKLDAEPEKLARQLIMIYEGNTQLFLITRDTVWLDRIALDFKDLLAA